MGNKNLIIMQKQISLKTKFFNFFRLIFKLPVLEKILIMFTLNKSSNSLIVKFIPNNYQYCPNTYRYAKRKSINYKLDLYDYVDWFIYFGIKDVSKEKLYRMINENNIVIDIGTNVGEVLMNFAKLVGNGGAVYGFEPDTINYNRCVENLNLNNFKNIYLEKLGLGHTKGKFKLIVNTPSNRGGNRIVSTINTDNNLEEIDIITLDEYIENKQIHSINLIKIDVEGFELNVLKGAVNTLRKFKPILFIEVDNNNLREQGASAKELIMFLENLNYSIINAENNKSVSSKDNFQNCHFDVICKSKDA